MHNRQKHALLGQHIREMRSAAGMTQMMLAEALGKPQSYVAKVEAGQRRIDVFEFIQIIETTGASVHDTIEYLRAHIL